jgi:outer membrane protein TolC
MALSKLATPQETDRAANRRGHEVCQYARLGLHRILLVSAICSAFNALSFAQTSTNTTPASAPGQAIPGTQGSSSFASSVPGKPLPGVIPISLQEAIDRGLRQNLGLLLSSADIGAARGQRWEQLSALLPHAALSPYVDTSKINFSEIGFNFTIPGVALPKAVAFSYFDARAGVTQTLFDWKAINAVRAASQSLRSAEYTYKDARDLVVLAVGYTYFQAIADQARIATAEAQVQTAQALFDQASDQVKAGTSPQIDALRAKVELQTRQQQLIQARNNFSIQKLTVARVLGLALGQEFDLIDKSPYQPFEEISIEDALKRAYASRSDYQSALKDLRAAQLSREAAKAGYLPSLSFSADYGAAGGHPSTATSVYDVRGTLTIPIFTGGSVHGDVSQADARLQQTHERLDSLRGQIDADVRTALFNLQSSADQVKVALSNIDLAEQTLTQSRDRFTAGVTDTVEVVQSQETVASAHEQYISSLYNFNFAKITLVRAMGAAETGFKEYFKGK